ncbi:MAG: DNA-binding IscR family transcriptional regulator [Roseivirga sp.]|jgi:DNA-binding IscR family transcriptional regulator
MVKSRFSIATHITTFVAKYQSDWITSGHLAKSLNINPVLVRNELADLKSADLIKSKKGKNGGVRLSIPAYTIQVAEIFGVAKGEGHVLAFSKNEGSKDCPIGSQIELRNSLR